MARGVNKVIILGNLGAEPEKRETPSGMTITNLRVATSEQWTDKQTGEKRENTEWHRVVLFGRQAEVAAQYLGKGSQVYIEGRIQTRKWQDKEGNDRYATEIIASEMQFIGGGSGGGGSGTGNGGRSANASSSAPRQQKASDEPAWSGGGPIGDDDVPFAQAERGMIA